MRFYLDTIDDFQPNAGRAGKIFRVSRAFYQKGKKQFLGPRVEIANDVFLPDMEMGEWLDSHGTSVALARVAHPYRLDFYLEFSDVTAAILYKLTWGGK